MGTNLSTSARSRKRLPMLPNAVNMSIASRASRCIESNPASTTGREIDRHLDAHTRFLRAIMKPKLFRRDSKGQKKSLEDYSVALARLDATLSKLFEALLKADRQMTFPDWKKLNSSLVVIHQDMKMTFKRAEKVIKSKAQNAKIHTKSRKLRRIRSDVEEIIRSIPKRSARTPPRKYT